jgi:hypothetical protein
MKRSWSHRAAWTLVVVAALGFGASRAYRAGVFDPIVLRADAPDKEDSVDSFRLDVFVLVGDNLRNPEGFCAVEPCAPGETLPTEQLFNHSGSPMGLSWGDWQTASARSRVSCKSDGNTDIRVRLSNLRPNAVYSLFYRTFGPDSINPLCIAQERSLVVAERCNGAGCVPVLDSRIETDADGEATYVGEVPGCLLDATTVLLDVIYHFNGTTYGQLPNQLESATQNPAGCTSPSEPGCDSCFSSFGQDAMRHAVIIQKQP